MVNLWHLRIGHINKKLKHLQQELIISMKRTSIWCTPCIEGKQHRIKYPKEGAFISTWMFKLIHFCKQTCIDIVGTL
jgi:hypothetical protein